MRHTCYSYLLYGSYNARRVFYKCTFPLQDRRHILPSSTPEHSSIRETLSQLSTHRVWCVSSASALTWARSCLIRKGRAENQFTDKLISCRNPYKRISCLKCQGRARVYGRTYQHITRTAIRINLLAVSNVRAAHGRAWCVTSARARLCTDYADSREPGPPGALRQLLPARLHGQQEAVAAHLAAH